MYERFTDRARKVMQLANQAAQRFGHEYIGTEHVLLGLVKEGSGVAAHVLKNLGLDRRKVREEVERIVRPGDDKAACMGRLPQTPRTRKMIEYSIEEARSLNHNYVGTEHLLLGLLRESEGIGAQVLLITAQRRSSGLDAQPGLGEAGSHQMRFPSPATDCRMELLVQLFEV
ncbi:MAG TPA: Clp protease N-terminal domain-containing protein, partial [Fimbriiglobus sp.]|nr:Clp protease N-terminal domain-containing protein [Fimbriiglobus sp.]